MRVSETMKFHAKTEDEIHLMQGHNSLKGKGPVVDFSVTYYP